MKTIMPTLMVLVIFAALLVCGSGCEEPTQTNDRQTRLIANENLQLTKQLTKCNEKIKQLSDALEKCKAEYESHKIRATDLNGELMDILSAANTKVATLTVENERLKAKIAESGSDSK